MKRIKRFIFTIIIIGLGYYLFINNINNKYNNIIILDTGEINSKEVIYYAKGMNKDDYKNSIEYTPVKVKSKKKYSKIIYNFDLHLKYSDLENIYNKLNNSDIVSLEVIGTSVDNRNIYSIEIGKGTKTIMFEAGTHASEIANPLFITKFIVDLVNKYEEGSKDIINLLTEYKIVVLPVVNPDGYDTAINGSSIIKNKELFTNKNSSLIDFHFYKANSNGVDLNRSMPSQNSGLHFKKNNLHYTVVKKPSVNRHEYFAGVSIGSQPETKALIYWHNKYYKNIYAYIALHSSGRVVYDNKSNLSDEINNLSNKCAQIVNDVTGYFIVGPDYDVGKGKNGTITDYLTELLSGYNFSEVTGRLSIDKYDTKYNELKYKACVIVIETLESYTKDLKIIKEEYYNYNFEKMFINLIKQ